MTEREEIRRRRLLAARRGQPDTHTVQGAERQDTRGEGNTGKVTSRPKRSQRIQVARNKSSDLS